MLIISKLLYSHYIISLYYVYYVVSDFSKFSSSTLGVGRGEKVLSSFLPGISLTLCELITSDNRIGQVRK